MPKINLIICVTICHPALWQWQNKNKILVVFLRLCKEIDTHHLIYWIKLSKRNSLSSFCIGTEILIFLCSKLCQRKKKLLELSHLSTSHCPVMLYNWTFSHLVIYEKVPFLRYIQLAVSYQCTRGESLIAHKPKVQPNIFE